MLPLTKLKYMTKPNRGGEQFYIIACLISLVAVWAIFNVPRDFLLAAGVLRNQDLLVLHLLLEGFSIVACVLIASTATLVRDQERLSSATLLAFGFSLIAGLDILHAVSLEGMPGFFFEASTSKAIFFWISARTVEVATILLFGLNFRVIKSPAIGVASAILVGALILYIGAYQFESIPALFIHNAGVTTLKVQIEYIIIAVNFICAALFYSRWRRDRKDQDIKISTACFIVGVGEFSVTGYLAPTDAVVILGHIFKASAYALLCHAIYVSNILDPRKRLAESQRAIEIQKRELNRILCEMPIEVMRFDLKLRYLYANPAHEERIGKLCEEVIGLPWHEQVPAALRQEIEPHLKKAMSGARAEFSLSYRDRNLETQDVDAIASLQRGNSGQGESILAIFMDVTARENAKRQLIKSLAEVSELRAALDAHAIVAITNAKGVITQVNDKFCQISKYPRSALLGKTHRIINSGYHPREFFVSLWKTIASGAVWTGEICNKDKDGGLYWVHTTIVPFIGAEGIPVQYIAIRADITQRKEAEQRAQELAYYDPLTGLPNRRLMSDRLRASMLAGSRNGHFHALMILDLDNFKEINDSQGHAQGDELLRQVAGRLSDCVRQGDTVARLGGDEFVVLINGLNSSENYASIEAHGVAEKIRSSIERSFELNGQTAYTSASIGISLFGPDSQPDDDLLKQADIALYRSKESGKNQASLFNPSMQAEVEAHSRLMLDLRGALGQGQFRLLYQVVVNADQQPDGYEALLRWVHPERGLVSPHEFIGQAEQSGLIVEIGQWVLFTACKQLEVWSKNPDTSKLTIAVNISARQLRDPFFSESVERILSQTNANPNLLRLELTESMFHSNVEATIKKMEKLQKIGVRFSLDDFGTGYSSLSYLKRLPLDQLKIDRSFVEDLLTDADDAAIAKTVLALAKALGLRVVAEGVERIEQFEFLKESGCNAFQGYLFGKPENIS